MIRGIDRRKFFTNTALSTAGAVLGSSLIGCAADRESIISDYNLMEDVTRYRKFDAHCHLEYDLSKQIEIADRLGITKMQISMPVANFSGNGPKGPDQVRKNHYIVLHAMKQYPDRFIGFLL